MGQIYETMNVPCRTMTLFFLIDTSGSMEDNKIYAVNDAIRNVLPLINDISENNSDTGIKIAALSFSSGAEWLYNEPKLVKDFSWQDLVAGGLTSTGLACHELATKLSCDEFVLSTNEIIAPAIILLSDGGPTDDFNSGLKKLKANNWFNTAIKIAIAIGDDANKNVLQQFTGSSESVITVNNIEALKQVINVAAVTSSKIGIKTGDDIDRQVQVIKEVKDAVNKIKGTETEDSICAGCDNWEWTVPDVHPSDLSSISYACQEITSKLSCGGMSTNDSFAPAIIILSDGSHTEDFYSAVRELKDNKWFQSAKKIAIAIGEDVDKEVLIEFTGAPKSVTTIHNAEALRQIIHAVTVLSSQTSNSNSN